MSDQCREYKIPAPSPQLETTVEGHLSFRGPHGVAEDFTEIVSQPKLSFIWSCVLPSTGVYPEGTP